MEDGDGWRAEGEEREPTRQTMNSSRTVQVSTV